MSATHVLDELRMPNVIDPELGLDFVALGLVYEVEVENKDVHITFTLTTPGCPIGPQVTEQMKEFVGEMEGVEKVFGIIDGTYFGFYSNLHKLGIEIVTPRHESCAAHMAGAYARLTGRLGVCMASNGPGVAKILPGPPVGTSGCSRPRRDLGRRQSR